MSPGPPSNTTLCLCFGGIPASSGVPTIHCDILPCHPDCKRPGWGALVPTGRSLLLLVLRSLDWWPWDLLCLLYSDHTGPGWCASHTSPRGSLSVRLGVDSAPYSPPSGAAAHPCSSCCCSQYSCQPSLTDQLYSALSGSLRAFMSPPAASWFPWAQRGSMYGVYVWGCWFLCLGSLVLGDG